jgi:DNA-binding response OmpR family regulator
LTTAAQSARRVRVLSVSADPGLRAARELLLKQHGFDVVTSLSKTHARMLLETEPFDILLFGSSLTSETCTELAKEFRGRNPEGKVVEVLSAPWAAPLNHPDSVAVSPEELLAAVGAP